MACIVFCADMGSGTINLDKKLETDLEFLFRILGSGILGFLVALPMSPSDFVMYNGICSLECFIFKGFDLSFRLIDNIDVCQHLVELLLR